MVCGNRPSSSSSCAPPKSTYAYQTPHHERNRSNNTRQLLTEQPLNCCVTATEQSNTTQANTRKRKTLGLSVPSRSFGGHSTSPPRGVHGSRTAPAAHVGVESGKWKLNIHHSQRAHQGERGKQESSPEVVSTGRRGRGASNAVSAARRDSFPE